MGTQVQDGLLVDLGGLVLGSVDLGVVLHEVRNAFHELALVNLLLEVLLAHVRQTDQQVHQDRDGNVFSHESQETLHEFCGVVLVLLQVHQSRRSVDDVRQHGRREV